MLPDPGGRSGRDALESCSLVSFPTTDGPALSRDVPAPATLGETLVSVWRQVLAEDREAVEIGAQHLEVVRTRRRGLRSVYVTFGAFKVEGIEQNPETASRWAKLARSGQRIMQFSVRGRYVGNVCEGRLTRYPSWTSMGLPP